jgi:hypothetical protein
LDGNTAENGFIPWRMKRKIMKVTNNTKFLDSLPFKYMMSNCGSNVLLLFIKTPNMTPTNK